MIEQSWECAMIALQIVAEEGPGRIVAEVERQERAALGRLSRVAMGR